MSVAEENVYMAKLAEQAERYDEMADYMKIVVETKGGDDLTTEERNLLSVAYKNKVGSRRASHRISESLYKKDKDKPNENGKLAQEYMEKIKTELTEICNEIIRLLDDHLINEEQPGESKVFYNKMKADYFRYMAEVDDPESNSDNVNSAKAAYDAATEAAEKNLAVTHPIRLGLALNFSVFNYEVLAMPDEACEMARKSFEDAIAELDNVSEENYKDSTLIMQLLRDNLTLWTSDNQDQQ